MKRFRLPLFSVFLLMSTLLAFPEFVTIGRLKYSCSNVSGQAVVWDGRYCSGFVNIPESFTYDGQTYRVVAIESCAFKDNKEMTSVYIPPSVKRIGGEAFRQCFRLKEVHISDLEAWCNIMFEGSGESSYMPGYEIDPKYEFEDPIYGTWDPAHQGFYEPGYGYFFPDYDFYDSNPLYRGHSLYLQGKLVTDVVVPDGVTQIMDGAFNNCWNIHSVNLPESVTGIGENAFISCRALSSISIPESVKEIGKSAFSGCSSLKSVKLPDAITVINEYLFEYCSSLESITFGNHIKNIWKGAFTDCNGLKAVHISDLGAWCDINFRYWYSNPLLYAGYLYLGGQPITDVVLPDDIKEIEDYTFNGSKTLSSVYIPESVKRIGDSSFNGCKKLTTVTIPDAVTRIGAGAFAHSGLTSVIIGKSVAEIGSGAFCDLVYNLKSIYCLNETPPVVDLNYWDKPSDIFDNYIATLYVPKGCKSAFEEKVPWNRFRNIQENDDPLTGVRSIGVDEGTPLTYYTLSGVKAATAAPGKTPANLPAGIYITRCGSKTEKVRIQ